MAIRNIYRNAEGKMMNFPDRRQRKIDQAFDMAGLARQDGDLKDEERWMKEARRLQQGGDLDTPHSGEGQ